jgi:two-component system nitrogen regulation response regulator NtrX
VAGNVRELKNLMERIVIMNPQVRVDARHIPLNPARRQVFERTVDRFGSLQEVREASGARVHSQEARRDAGECNTNRGVARLERSNLYRKMKSLGIAPERSLTRNRARIGSCIPQKIKLIPSGP